VLNVDPGSNALTRTFHSDFRFSLFVFRFTADPSQPGSPSALVASPRPIPPKPPLKTQKQLKVKRFFFDIPCFWRTMRVETWKWNPQTLGGIPARSRIFLHEKFGRDLLAHPQIRCML
jgi:hypothetical protein